MFFAYQDYEFILCLALLLIPCTVSIPTAPVPLVKRTSCSGVVYRYWAHFIQLTLLPGSHLGTENEIIRAELSKALGGQQAFSTVCWLLSLIIQIPEDHSLSTFRFCWRKEYHSKDPSLSHSCSYIQYISPLPPLLPLSVATLWKHTAFSPQDKWLSAFPEAFTIKLVLRVPLSFLWYIK